MCCSGSNRGASGCQLLVTVSAKGTRCKRAGKASDHDSVWALKASKGKVRVDGVVRIDQD